MTNELNPYYELPFRSGDQVFIDLISGDPHEPGEIYTFDDATVFGVVVRDYEETRIALFPWAVIRAVVSA